jgi:hypothetical protein
MLSGPGVTDRDAAARERGTQEAHERVRRRIRPIHPRRQRRAAQIGAKALAGEEDRPKCRASGREIGEVGKVVPQLGFEIAGQLRPGAHPDDRQRDGFGREGERVANEPRGGMPAGRIVGTPPRRGRRAS